MAGTDASGRQPSLVLDRGVWLQRAGGCAVFTGAGLLIALVLSGDSEGGQRAVYVLGGVACTLLFTTYGLIYLWLWRFGSTCDLQPNGLAVVDRRGSRFLPWADVRSIKLHSTVSTIRVRHGEPVRTLYMPAVESYRERHSGIYRAVRTMFDERPNP